MATKRALFESWRGRYNDSPKVISQRLGEVLPEIEQSWVSSERGRFPEGTRRVPRHTAQYFLELARSDLLFTNDIVTKHVVKGPKVVYFQAWHGSPIKVIGLDERAPKYRSGAAHLKRTARDVGKWDYLLSPSVAYTKIFRGAFGYDGEVLEVGYPRNDILVTDDGTSRGQVRDSLGVDPGAIVILYAPTWRDDAERTADGFEQPELIDWELLFENLPSNAVILNRLHQHAATGELPELGGRLIDVSRHEDVTELILAADALISDYSSIIYDFAVTGRPIVLHAPDLGHYRNSVRPFYFEYESWAPGPITSTTLELASVLSSLPAVSSEYRDHYQDFRHEFCTFENGHAASRVIETIVERHLT